MRYQHTQNQRFDFVTAMTYTRNITPTKRTKQFGKFQGLLRQHFVIIHLQHYLSVSAQFPIKHVIRAWYFQCARAESAIGCSMVCGPNLTIPILINNKKYKGLK